MKKYKNVFNINQRGASISINNSTGRESFQISHRSGSNIHINNLVNSEFAYNNKQLYVIHNYFENVSNDKIQTVKGHNTIKTGKNLYRITGYNDVSEINELIKWKDSYTPIAKLNSQFRIKRGGVGYPLGDTTPQEGSREGNPVLTYTHLGVNNKFNSYEAAPIRSSSVDEVTNYTKVSPKGLQAGPSQSSPSVTDIMSAAGSAGSSAPGVLEFGASVSAATEGGTWNINDPHIDAETETSSVIETIESQSCSGEDPYICDIPFNYKKIPLWDATASGDSGDCQTTVVGVNVVSTHQSSLVFNERYSGQFGDDIGIIKRHKFEQVGATFNDFPSIRIDPKGRSQPLEMLVGPKCVFKNHDYAPHIEEVDNSSNFPCGNDVKIIGNRMSRKVGSGGVDIKTTGVMEFGSTRLHISSGKVFISSNYGVTIASDAGVEIESQKSITLRTNRQVYVECSMGIKSNLIVGGGTYIEGETYVHHITAPVEMQQTEDTHLFGKFATNNDRALIIGEVEIFGNWFNVYAKASQNIIYTYPHSHHFKNIPLRLTASNEDVRKLSMSEGINTHGATSAAVPQIHQRKSIVTT